MDSPNVIDRSELARAEIDQLVDAIRLGPPEADAVRRWIGFLFRGDRTVEIDESFVRSAYQVSLLARAARLQFEPAAAEWFERLDSVATTIDIYARLAPRERRRALFRLATVLYLIALQPTKARRVSVELRSQAAETDLIARLHNALSLLSNLQGENAISQVQRQISNLLREFYATDPAEDPIQQLREVSLSEHEATLHGLAINLELARRFRRTYDLPSSVNGQLPQAFVELCVAGTGSRGRAELFPPQEWALRRGALDSQVVAISTPTGSGKTFLAELRIASELSRASEALCVYVAPFNSLANQVFGELSDRIGNAGWRVDLWTGAYELGTGVAELGSVLVTTPEKLDFILRSRLEEDRRSLDLMNRARLFIFDESHLIAAGKRGLRYEFLIARLRRLLPQSAVLSMSGVQHDAEAFGEWIAGDRTEALAVPLPWRPARVWDILWRKDGRIEARGDPEPIVVMPRPATPRKAAALVAGHLLERLRSILLIDTRKEWAEGLARELFREHRDSLDRRLERTEALTTDARERLSDLANLIKRDIHPRFPLAEYVEIGLAFHHAGLPPTIRRRIEELAREEVIHTLVSTTTLAEGMDLPFRAVVLVHLNLPFGPVPVSTLRNLRGRAGRPFYANDGIFVVLEPERTDTATYQFFLDHFWEETVERPEAASGLVELLSYNVARQQEAVRVLQSQLLALFSEQTVELEEVPTLIDQTYLAAKVGRSSQAVRQVATVIDRQARSMLEEPALLSAASPIQLTPLGRSVALGGLSGESGKFVHDYLLQVEDQVEDLIRERGSAWMAVRMCWLPWEAVESTTAYQSSLRDWRSLGLQRSTESLINFEDQRLQKEYALSDYLLEPRTFHELAISDDSAELLRGRGADDRLVNGIEWASDKSGLLPWTLTGVIRIAQLLGESSPSYTLIGEDLLGFVQYLQYWMPTDLGVQLCKFVVDRDSAIRLLRVVDPEATNMGELADWVDTYEERAVSIVGPVAVREIRRLAIAEVQESDL